MFERETRREKILETRHREMRLKERTASQQGNRGEDDNKEGKIIFVYGSIRSRLLGVASGTLDTQKPCL